MVTINKAIKRAIEIKGISLLSDSQLLIIVLEDLAPELEQEREFISKYHTVNIGNSLINIYDNLPDHKNKMYSDLESQLVQEQPNLSKEYHYYLSFFTDAVGCVIGDQSNNDSAISDQVRGTHSVSEKISPASNVLHQPKQSFIEMPQLSNVGETPVYTAAKATAQRSPPITKTHPFYSKMSAKDATELDDAVRRYFDNPSKAQYSKRLNKIIVTLLLLIVVMALVSFYVFSAVFSGNNDSNIISGDLNGDGIVTEEDLSILQDYLMDVESIPDDKLKVADYDGDGKITSHDALKMKNDLKGE